MNFDSIEILSDGSLEKPDVHDADGGLITQVRTAHETGESPIRENLGTSLAEKSQIDKDSVAEAKWVLDLLKELPDVRDRLASSVGGGSLADKILKGDRYGYPDWKALIDALHEGSRDSCHKEDALLVDLSSKGSAIKIGQGAFGIIYRRKANNEILKVPIIDDDDPVGSEVEGLLEKAFTKYLGVCPNTVSLADHSPVCLHTRGPLSSPFFRCFPPDGVPGASRSSRVPGGTREFSKACRTAFRSELGDGSLTSFPPPGYSGPDRQKCAMGVFLPQLLQSLSCIHKQGYIHSDLKPGNVLFFQRTSKQCPDVKIADFGLARPIGTKFDRQFVGVNGSYFSTVPPGRTSHTDGQHSPRKHALPEHGRLGQNGSWSRTTRFTARATFDYCSLVFMLRTTVWNGFGVRDALQGKCTPETLKGAGKVMHKDGTGDCVDCDWIGPRGANMRVIYSRTELEKQQAIASRAAAAAYRL